jgi:hypothetical protein
MTTHRKGHGCALVVFAVGLGLACEPIVGAPSPSAPINSCPARPCDAYNKAGATPACNAGVCTVAAQTTNLLLVIGLAADSYLAPGRTYLTTLSSASKAPASCSPPSCCLLPDCTPPACALPIWFLQGPNSYLVDHTDEMEAQWYLGNPGAIMPTAVPVQATFRRLFDNGLPDGGGLHDAVDLGLPVDPVLADNVTLAGDNGPNGTAPVTFQTYLQRGCYERTLQPYAPFSRAFPPEIKAWPPDDSSQGIQFDETQATGQGETPPTFDIARAEGLEGWTAYLRNVQTKRVFSNVVPLTGSLKQNVVLLSKHEPDLKHDALTGLEVVLAPPSGQPLPTEFFAPAGTPPSLELRRLLPYPSLPTPVTMSGRIQTPARAPVPADIYFSATDIAKDRSGQKFFPPNFEFSTRVSTTRDPTTGASTYSVLLPQGDYQIAVRPTDRSNALTVAQRLVGGQGNEMTGDFDVTPLVQLSGMAAVADGRALAEAIVELLPTQCAATVGDAGAADSSDACLPRSAQTGTASDGTFRLMVDPGGYLLRIRPREGSRLPWKILPIVVNASPVVVDPIIPAPVSVGMTLTSNNNPVPNAVVRVFTDPSQGGPAVELGEAITDGDGNYEMYIAPPDQ